MSRDKQIDYKISKESVDKLFPNKDIDIMGYESPIKVIMGQMRMEQENNIYRAIRDYGVDVDKEELIKALQYDRNQYEKGYINGYNAKSTDVAEEIFAEIEKMLLDNHIGHYKTTIDTWCYNFNNEIISEIAELKKKYIGEDTNQKGEGK